MLVTAKVEISETFGKGCEDPTLIWDVLKISCVMVAFGALRAGAYLR